MEVNLLLFLEKMKKDNMNISSKTKAEESEETEKVLLKEEEGVEEDKGDLKDKLPNNKPPPKKSLSSNLEHVLCQILFNFICFYQSHYFFSNQPKP